jgi:hypothetical protein
LLVAHAIQDLVDGGVESGALWRRRDRDAARALTRLTACLDIHRRQLLQRAEDDAQERR